jgi:hypothetical protein
MSLKTLNRYFKEHDLSAINYGKTYKYSIDKSFVKPYINQGRIIFQTPMLYIPYKARHVDSYNTGSIGTDNWQLDVSLYNQENDPDVLEFLTWIRDLEDTIYKGLRRRSNLGITRAGQISVLKHDEYHDCFKLSLKLDSKQSNFYLLEGQGQLGQAFDFKSGLRPACYGLFILELTNIWLRRNRTELDTATTGTHEQVSNTVSWGLSFAVHAAQCLPSHVALTPVPEPLVFIKRCNIPQPPPPPPMPMPIGGQLNVYEKQQLPDQFQKMLKLGIPMEAVLHKMKMMGISVGNTNGLNNSIISTLSSDKSSSPVKITPGMLSDVRLKKATTGLTDRDQNQSQSQYTDKSQLGDFSSSLGICNAP